MVKKGKDMDKKAKQYRMLEGTPELHEPINVEVQHTKETEQTKQFKKFVETMSANLTDEQAQELPYCFPEWKEGVEIKEGERYRIASSSFSTYASEDDSQSTDELLPLLYKCKKNHMSTEENYPEVTPDLWTELKGE